MKHLKTFLIIVLVAILGVLLVQNKKLTEENSKLFRDFDNARYLFTQCKILLRGF